MISIEMIKFKGRWLYKVHVPLYCGVNVRMSGGALR